MTKEKIFQGKVSNWLKSQGAVVLKTAPGVLNPTGIPDLLVLYGNRWCMLEIKREMNAKRQVLQNEQIERFYAMNPGLVLVVYPENWDCIQNVLNEKLFRKNPT